MVLLLTAQSTGVCRAQGPKAEICCLALIDGEKMNIAHFQKLKELIQEASNTGLLTTAKEVTGFSGKKVVGTLQRISKLQASAGHGCYLEIGVFQGMTLISVASVLRDTPAYGIDNFSQLDTGKENEGIVLRRMEINNLGNVRLINSDYEAALVDLNRFIGNEKVGTYFIDGPHDYRSQLNCLELIKPHLSALAVIIVDDSNYNHVRMANRDFLLANRQFKMLFEAYTDQHPMNMNEKSVQGARDGWWNGVNIIVFDPHNELSEMLPIASLDRELFLNDHIIHSERYGFLAPQAVRFFEHLLSLKLLSALKLFFVITAIALRRRRELGKRHQSMNTFSDNLRDWSMNQTLQ